MRLFHRISKGTLGVSAMDKLMTNIETDIDSSDFELKKLATDSLFKILPYVMPRESNGSQLNVQINNKISGGNHKSTTESVVLGLQEFASLRMKKIQEVEERRDKKTEIRLKQVGLVEKDSTDE